MKHIAIIGAGPVGLTMAILLQQQGLNVAVYERDKDPGARIWGGTLDLHIGTGQEAMKKAGLLGRYYELALPMGIVFTDEHGRALSTKPPRNDNPEISRNVLRKMLLNSLTNNTVHWDCKCTGLEPKDDQWQVHFESGINATADLVIGANGGMSKIRSYVTDAVPVETGTVIIQGDVPQPKINCPEFYQLCNGKRLMAAHNGTLLVANPYNNGVLTYGVIFKAEHSSPGLNLIDLLVQRCAKWHKVYTNLFRSTKDIVGLPTKRLPLDQAWKTNRPLPITLIGDAAHLMPPFAGQGVNTGLMDALTLSENLARFDSVPAAIADYERQMMAYAGKAQQASGENEIAMRDPAFSFRQLLD